MTPRAAILCGLLGKPWKANGKGPDEFDCWHLARAASAALFGRDLPEIAVPAAPTYRWLMETIACHPERAQWRECPAGPLITAGDGAIVLMARRDRPAHIGLWCAPERRILHADEQHGSVFESPVDLRTKGWSKLRFYEPCDCK